MIPGFSCSQLNRLIFQILLGFPKDDPLSDHLVQAAEKLGYEYTVSYCPDNLVDVYVQTGHDIVVLDNRNIKHLDAVAICRWESRNF